MKLTEDDFDWWLGCDKSDQYTLHVTEIGKQQILDNAEKAEIYYQQLKGEQHRAGTLQVENKKLKEENKHLTDINYERFFSIDELRKRNKKLKDENDNYEEMIETKNRYITVLQNKIIFQRKKLEKCKKILKNHIEEDGYINPEEGLDKLEEILEGKSD